MITAILIDKKGFKKTIEIPRYLPEIKYPDFKRTEIAKQEEFFDQTTIQETTFYKDRELENDIIIYREI